ncbi:MAG: pantetheine-phosphate adenylyltransferase [Eubacterium sp.]|nr:pantetheine-phosphate adenylyltransferase [Eubacterium sp.]
MATAVYPGSFDPITFGHLDIVQRASEVFDKVIIGVLKNQTKNPLFSLEERVDMIEKVTSDIPNVEVVSFGGLLVDFCKQVGADVVVRGLRAVSDFEYELMMAQTNKELNPNLETMFFATSARYSFLSSSTVRELAMFDADIRQFVPEYVHRKVYEKLKEEKLTV